MIQVCILRCPINTPLKGYFLERMHYFGRIILGIVGVSIVVIAILLVILLKVMKNASLNIYVAPASAEVLIDGTKYNNGTYTFYPGEHTVTISADGFETKTIGIEMGANESTDLFEFLNGTEDAKYYEKVDNKDDYEILKQIAAYNEDAKTIVDRIEEAQKIYDYLPKVFKGEGYHFAIEKSKDCESILCLKICNFLGNNYYAAISEIKNLGYEPDVYEILNEDPVGTRMPNE